MKNNKTGILLSLFEIALGILLLIDPIGFTTGIIIIAGVLLLLFGVVEVIKYFRTDAVKAASEQYLTKGLCALGAGVFCVVKTEWFTVAFPAMTFLYGIVVLVTGLSKLQLTVDMLRVKSKKWFLALISAAISIVCAVLILMNPFSSTEVLWMIAGITLIVEALLDVVTWFLGGREQKKKAAPAENASAENQPE